jgi:hypothetical protein
VAPQALLAAVMTKHHGKLAVLKELFLVLACLKPAVEIWRLAHGAEHDPGAPADPKAAMIFGKITERVLESIPAAILQTVTLLDHADARSAWAVASIVIACVATAFVATTIAFNKDTDTDLRHKYPQFYGCADSPRPPHLTVCAAHISAYSIRMAASSTRLLQAHGRHGRVEGALLLRALRRAPRADPAADRHALAARSDAGLVCGGVPRRRPCGDGRVQGRSAGRPVLVARHWRAVLTSSPAPRQGVRR